MPKNENPAPLGTRVHVTTNLPFTAHLNNRDGVVTNAPRMVGPNTSCLVRFDGEQSSRVIPVSWLS